MTSALPSRPNADANAAAAEMLKKLGHPSRLMILNRLLHGEATVAEMELELGLKQPGLSQQLAELRNAGIIEARRDARGVTYCLVDADARSMIREVRRVFLRGGARDDAVPPTPRLAASAGGEKLFGAAMFARAAEHG